ncbi:MULTISPECIES: CBS domain-containing protein [unclassified Pseudoalteromonas]|jgi:predicted transcriptional regulator|uniref:CBS domain-containing protein n=1 Tax=unclassified Pseudoalteromonas TaxID=194690 RepID=UPI0005A8A7FA|nr:MULTISPECIES: CBS domain-containing protein [unclassified Pseudoalteromonas]
MKSIRVADYMNKRPVTFNVDMTVAEASEKLIRSHQIGGPVVDVYMHVIGFVSEQECLSGLLEDTYLSDPHTTVATMMQEDVLTVSMDDSILDLAQQIQGNKPKIYPVVDKNKRLLGIITRSDILKAIDIHLRSFYENGHDRIV